MSALQLSSRMTAERRATLFAAPERRAVSDLIDAANTLHEVRHARAALLDWLTRNPDDFGILDAGEVLANVEASLTADGEPIEFPVNPPDSSARS